MLPRSLFLLAIHAVLALGVASAEPKAYVVEKYPVKCAPDGFATLGAWPGWIVDGAVGPWKV